MKNLKNRQIIISLIMALLIFMALPSTASAKAGGVGSANITNITLDASQAPPTCGRASPCHDETLSGFEAEANLTVTFNPIGTTNIETEINVVISVNESVDEIGCLIMNHTTPDFTNTWAEAINMTVVKVNTTGISTNYYESTGSYLSFNFTMVPTTPGLKNMTLACGGGLTEGGQQDWAINTTLAITVTDPIILESSRDFEVRFIGNHFECPQNSCWITVDFNGNSSHINCTLDNQTERQICANCTRIQAKVFPSLALGMHTLNISTLLGDRVIKFKTVSDVLNGTELADAVWQHNETERTTNNYLDKILGGDIMTNPLLLLIVMTFGTIAIAEAKKDKWLMLFSTIWPLMIFFYSITNNPFIEFTRYKLDYLWLLGILILSCYAPIRAWAGMD